MKISFESGRPTIKNIEQAMEETGIPAEYQGFVRQITNLSPDEREAKIEQMSEDPDFKKSADQIRSFFRTYDNLMPHSVPAEAPKETHAEPGTAAPEAQLAGTHMGERGAEGMESHFKTELGKLPPVFREISISPAVERVILSSGEDAVQKFFDHLREVVDMFEPSVAEKLKDRKLKISPYPQKFLKGSPAGEVVEVSLSDLMGDVDHVEQIVDEIRERVRQGPVGANESPERTIEKSDKLEEWEKDFALEMLASLGIEYSEGATHVNEQDMRDFLNKFRDEQKSSGRSAESLIRGRLSDPGMIRNFAKKWEEKYGPERVWKKRMDAFNEGKVGEEEPMTDLPRTKEGMPRVAPPLESEFVHSETSPMGPSVPGRGVEAQKDMEKWEADLALAVLRYNGIDAPDEDELHSQVAEIRAEAAKKPIRQVISGMMDVASEPEVEKLLEHWEDNQPMGGALGVEEVPEAGPKMPSATARERNAESLAHSERWAREFMGEWKGERPVKKPRPAPGYPADYLEYRKDEQSVADFENEGGAIPQSRETTTEQSADMAGREERFAEARRELEVEGSPSKTLRTALEVLEKVRTMPTEEAVRYVIGAKQRFEILEYHTDVILHALIPDRVPKPTEGNVSPTERTGPAAEAAPEEVLEERVISPEREALERQLRDGIDLREDAYGSIRGEKDARSKVLAGGPDGIRNFLERLDMFTRALRSDLVPYVMKRCDLTITATKETGASNKNIDVNIEDLMSEDIQQLAEKVKKGLAVEEVHEARVEEHEETPADNAAEAAAREEAARRAREVGREVRSKTDAEVPPVADRQERPAGGTEAPRPKEGLIERPPRYVTPEEKPGWRERVRETGSRLAERFGAKNLADWTRIAYSKPFIDWQDSRAARLKGKLDDKLNAISALTDARGYLQEELRTLKSEGDVSGKALMGMEKERAERDEKIEKARNKANRLQSKLEYRNSQRARYENRRNEVCRGFIARVEERLNPFEARLSDLKMTQGQLKQEAAHYQGLLKERQEKIKQLKAKVEAEKQFPSVRKAHREIIKQIERQAKDIASEITAREKDRGRIDKKITKQDKKANPFRDKRDKLIAITKRTGRDTAVEPRRREEEASVEAREVSDHPRAENESAEENLDEASTKREGNPTHPPRPEFEKKYSGKDLVGKWNALYGSRMAVNPETAAKSFPSLFAEPHSVAEFEDFLGFYSERHGDDERFEAMPSMQKAARKKRGWWNIFGGRNKGKSQSRLLEALNRTN